MGPDGPKWGQEDFFLANPDLADILGRTDFDFENFYFWDFFGSQISRFPGSKILDFPISKFLDFPIPRFPHGRPGGGRGDGRAGEQLLPISLVLGETFESFLLKTESSCGNVSTS